MWKGIGKQSKMAIRAIAAIVIIHTASSANVDSLAGRQTNFILGGFGGGILGGGGGAGGPGRAVQRRSSR